MSIEDEKTLKFDEFNNLVDGSAMEFKVDIVKGEQNTPNHDITPILRRTSMLENFGRIIQFHRDCQFEIVREKLIKFLIFSFI